MNDRESWWYLRGIADAKADKAPLFKKKGEQYFAKGKWPNEPDEENSAGRAYLEGYNGQ